MRDTEFQHWLQVSTTITPAAQANARSRCKRVETYEGDLDEHFSTDRMKRLLTRLHYSSMDEGIGAAPRHTVPMSEGANIRNGTSSLANAVRQYLSFCEAWPSGALLAPSRQPPSPKPGAASLHQFSHTTEVVRPTSAWPDWNLPAKADLLQLARITTPYIRYFNPEIVTAVVEDNEKHRCAWETQLSAIGIDPSLYLWERSSCAFPGVRRYAGSSEIAQHRQRMEVDKKPEQAIKLDDNHYPKVVWSFVFREKTFQNQGPLGYSLAHLTDHKQYKNRSQEEFDVQGDMTVLPTTFGLFTSVANTVYMPVGLIRPTDFAFTLRNLIQRRAHCLYGDFCNVVPPNMSFRAAESGAWSLDAFD